MSLRTSAHTGVAIRIPAGMPGKLAAVWANSWRFSDLPKVLLFVLCCRKEYGLPRRCAPRNDMQRLAVCLRRKNVLPLKPAPAYAFALSTAYLRGCGLPQRFPACNGMPKNRDVSAESRPAIVSRQKKFSIFCKKALTIAGIWRRIHHTSSPAGLDISGF